MNRVYKKRKKKKKVIRSLKLIRLIVILAIITSCVYFGYKYRIDKKVVNAAQTIAKLNKTTPTKVNAEEQEYSSENLKLLEGQSQVSGADGYTMTFSTLNEKNKKIYKEFKQNLETASWSEKSYWGGTMRENGCGITSLAIVASGYNNDNVTPETLREEYYPHLDGDKIQEALEDIGIKCTDFFYDESYLSKKYIRKWLLSGRPIIICVGNEKKNKWTTSSHYMTLLDINSKGYVYLSNPNGLEGEDNNSRLV